MSQKIYIGCSGWQYDHWKGLFYPEDIRKKDWLPFYKKHFNTVEVNATFYHLPKISTFEKWKNEAGNNFLFTIKGSRYITYTKRLNKPLQSVQKFYDHAVYLSKKIGAVLWQMKKS